jgi:hypothetical protein
MAARDGGPSLGRGLLDHPRVQLLLVVMIAFIPRAASAGSFGTIDEVRWMQRSDRFIDAVVHLDFANASSTVSGLATMPGITTVWVGGIARGLWSLFDAVGIGDSTNLPFESSPFAWTLAQLVAAAVSALLIGALWWVLVRWTTRIAAFVAVMLLATEPFFVGHGALLHTDSFVALFAALGTFALLAVADVPRGTPLQGRERTIMAVLAGIGLAGSVLTKTSALAFAPFALVIVVIAGVRAWRTGDRRRFLTAMGIVAAAGVALVVVLWPAIWADPAGQIRIIWRSASAQVESGRKHFWFGETVDGGPLEFYFVAVPFRMTPWFLVLTVASLVGTLIARETRRYAFAVLGSMVIPWISISLSSLKYDRYATMVWPAFAVLVGLFTAAVLARVRARWPIRQAAIVAVGAVLAGLLLINTLVIAPYNLSYFNPALGGSQAARRTLLVGWGEGLEQAGEIIERDQGGCTHVRVATHYRIQRSFVCERPVPLSQLNDLRPGEYIVLYVNYEQRAEPKWIRALRRAGTPVGEVNIRGVRYAEVLKVKRPVDR